MIRDTISRIRCIYNEEYEEALFLEKDQAARDLWPPISFVAARTYWGRSD
jgi:hypothetical protein